MRRRMYSSIFSTVSTVVEDAAASAASVLGKSLVAQALHFKALCEGRRSFYTSPIKALASEKFFDWCDAFGPENVGMLTGDASANPDAQILCCTAEVLSNMALRQGAELDAPYVVMDEFHFYDDPDRGVAWQVPLLELPRTQFLLMSATVGNTAVIEAFLQQYDLSSEEGVLLMCIAEALLRIPDADTADRLIADKIT